MVQPNERKVTDLTGLVDATWKAVGNPPFKAVLEAWLAMANDPSLRGEIGMVVAEFASLVSPDAMRSILTNQERRDFHVTTGETMTGLALGSATNGGKPLDHERRVIARMRAEAVRI